MLEQLISTLKNRNVSNIKQHNAYLYFKRYESYLNKYRNLDPGQFESRNDYYQHKYTMAVRLNNGVKLLYNFIWNSNSIEFNLPTAKGGKK